VLTLRSSYLERLGVMDRHYGYINRLSREASTMLNAEERRAIREAVEITQDIPIEGGHEYLAQHPDGNEQSLDQLWATKKSLKIRSGFYIQRYTLDGRETVLVNGFHPMCIAEYKS